MIFEDPYIGRAIQRAREKKGLQQKELAELIGVNKTTMNRYEKGETRVPEEKLRKISTVTNRTIISIMKEALGIWIYNQRRAEGIETETDSARSALLEQYRSIHAEFDEKRRALEQLDIELKFLEESEGIPVVPEVIETKKEKRARQKPRPRKRSTRKEEASGE